MGPMENASVTASPSPTAAAYLAFTSETEAYLDDFAFPWLNAAMLETEVSACEHVSTTTSMRRTRQNMVNLLASR